MIGTEQLLVWGEVVKRRRTKAGVSRAELAAKVGKDEEFIGLVEQGKKSLTAVEFIEVAQALGVQPTLIVMEVMKRMEEQG